MEQARIILAFALSFLVFLVWSWFFQDQKPVMPGPEPQEVQQEQVAQKEIPPPVKDAAAPSTPNLPKPEPEADMGPARTITVDTPFYRAQIPERGAGFSSFLLKKYKETADPDSPLLQMVDTQLQNGTVHVLLDQNSAGSLAAERFITDAVKDHIEVNSQPRTVSFSYQRADGLVLTKSYTFSPDRYVIGLNVTLTNHSANTYQDSLVFSLENIISDKKSRYGFTGPSALVNNHMEEVKIKKIEENNLFPGQINWIAFQGRYFLTSVLPDVPKDATFRLVLDEEQKQLSSQIVYPRKTLLPGSQTSHAVMVFAGPKNARVLKKLNRGLDRAVNFGWFNIIGKGCLWLMNLIYGIIPNYGVAIILMTLLIKIVLWPLGSKSYKSMSEMKKLQPLMAQIREKHKDDKQKMNEELMGLYRTYKINPLSGCFPMLVQFPVFIALYRMLYEAIELRHAPFLGWINDLSAPDRLFHFDFAIPIMQAPYGIPVLTLVMGATMFLQQKMSPPMGDPAQAKMMMLMPVIFTVIFVNFSSGLVLYWLVNNILSIAQQYYIQKKFA